MKYLCDCGEIIRTSGDIPNPAKWKFVSEEEYFSLSPKSGYWQIYRAMTVFFKCENCGRLWFWWGNDEKPTVYKLDEE